MLRLDEAFIDKTVEKTFKPVIEPCDIQQAHRF